MIGGPPQDKKYKGAPTKLEIGNGNVVREAVTIHIGTEKGGGITRVGDNNLLMVNAHIGHDAQIGSNCILANNVMIAGHVVIGDNVAMMGGVGIHHFVTIGDYAYLGAYARIHHDVPPFCKVDGADQVRGLNTVGLRRAGFPIPTSKPWKKPAATSSIRKNPSPARWPNSTPMNGINPQVKKMVEFLQRRDLENTGDIWKAFGQNSRILIGCIPVPT